MKTSTKYNYQGAIVPIEVVVFNFTNGSPDYILSKDQYEKEGKFKGIIKSHEFSIRDIDHLEKGTMSPYEFENLPEWEG